MKSVQRVSEAVSRSPVVAAVVMSSNIGSKARIICLGVVVASENTIDTILVQDESIEETANTLGSAGKGGVESSDREAGSSAHIRVEWLILREGLGADIRFIDYGCVDCSVTKRNRASEAGDGLRGCGVGIGAGDGDLEVSTG